MDDYYTKLADVVFNGRPAEAPKPSVTIAEIIKRKKSIVLVAGKLYRITAEEVSVAAKA